jgi:hypothetical protein
MLDLQGNRILVSNTGKGAAWVGGIFAAVGLLFVVLLCVSPKSVTVNDRPGRTEDAWVPGIFVLIGLAIAGIRRRREIDVDQHAVIDTSGWWWWTKTSVIGQGAWKCVRIGNPEERGQGSSRYTAIPVSIVGADSTFEVEAPGDFADARELAQRIAQAGKIPIGAADESGAVTEMPPEQIGKPLVERIGKQDLDVPRPEDSRVTVESEMGGCRIRLSPGPVNILAALVLIPLLVPIGFWYFLWFPGLDKKIAERPDDHALLIFAYLPLVLMVGIPLVFMIRAFIRGRLSTVIEIDSDRGLRFAGHAMPAAEIMALPIVSAKLGSNRRLMAVTDSHELVIARGLTEPDLRYLRAEILRALK